MLRIIDMCLLYVVDGSGGGIIDMPDDYGRPSMPRNSKKGVCFHLFNLWCETIAETVL